MTAKSTKERSAKAAAKRREKGIVTLRLPAMEGTGPLCSGLWSGTASRKWLRP